MAALATIADVAAEIGAESLRSDALALGERIQERRIYVACVGQLKRGKSTFINAAVGREVLPAGVLPVTAVPVVVRYGSDLIARVRTTADGLREVPLGALEQYVSEACNPENAKGVEYAEVFISASILANGLCFVDVPGVGSVFHATTETARTFAPQIDVAVVLLGVDPPLTADELAMIEAVGGRAGEVVLVLNKADRFTELERSSAAAFAERVVSARLGHIVGPVLQVSATERLSGTGPDRCWGRLLDTLNQVTDRADGLAADALSRGQVHLARRCLRILAAASEAVMRPVVENDRTAERLRDYVGDIALDALRLRRQLEREQRRFSDLLAQRREPLLARERACARDELVDAIRRAGSAHGWELRQVAMQSAREVVARRVVRWPEQGMRYISSLTRRLEHRFAEIASEALSRVEQSDIVTAGPPTILSARLDQIDQPTMENVGLDASEPIGAWERPPNAEDETIGSVIGKVPPNDSPLPRPSAIQRLFDAIGSSASVRSAIERDACSYLDQLLTEEVARIEGAVLAYVSDRSEQVVARARATEQEIYHAVDAAVARARAAEKSAMQAARTELDRLDGLRRRVLALLPANDSVGAATLRLAADEAPRP